VGRFCTMLPSHTVGWFGTFLRADCLSQPSYARFLLFSGQLPVSSTGASLRRDLAALRRQYRYGIRSTGSPGGLAASPAIGNIAGHGVPSLALRHARQFAASPATYLPGEALAAWTHFQSGFRAEIAEANTVIAWRALSPLGAARRQTQDGDPPVSSLVLTRQRGERFAE
jgi:hypothetical protein